MGIVDEYVSQFEHFSQLQRATFSTILTIYLTSDQGIIDCCDVELYKAASGSTHTEVHMVVLIQKFSSSYLKAFLF